MQYSLSHSLSHFVRKLVLLLPYGQSSMRPAKRSFKKVDPDPGEELSQKDLEGVDVIEDLPPTKIVPAPRPISAPKKINVGGVKTPSKIEVPKIDPAPKKVPTKTPTPKSKTVSTGKQPVPKKVIPKKEPKPEADDDPKLDPKKIFTKTLKTKLGKIYKAHERNEIELENKTEVQNFLEGLPRPGSKEYAVLDAQIQGVINLAYHKAESAIRFLIVDSDLSGKARFELCQYAKDQFPSNFTELVRHLVDVLGLKQSQGPEMVLLYEALVSSKLLSSAQKMELAQKLYSRGQLGASLEGFEIVASDPSAEWRDRLEASKFLLVGDDSEKHELAQEVLSEIVADPKTMVILADPSDVDVEGSRSSASEDGAEEDFFSSSSEEDQLPDFLRDSDDDRDSNEDRAGAESDEEKSSEESGDIFSKQKKAMDPAKLEKKKADREAKKQARDYRKWEEATNVRYSIISDFLSSITQINRHTRKRKIIPAIITRTFGKKLIPCDGLEMKEFVLPISIIFVRDPTNHIRSRIMACSIMYECGDESVKTEAYQFLMGVGADTTFSEDERADALDKITFLAGDRAEEKTAARKLLMDLGTESQDTGFKNKIKTIYNNSQNVHDDTVNSAVIDFINSFDPYKEIHSFSEVESEIAALYQTYSTSASDIKKARSAIYRCFIDHSRFGNDAWPVKKIFCYIWSLVQDYRESKKIKVDGKLLKGAAVADLLEKRFVEALIEMGDTCTTGHVSRLAQVMDGFGLEIRISYRDQIKSNVSGRIQALVRDEPDEAIRDQLALGAMDDADADSRKIYRKWMEGKLNLLVKELWKEFSTVKGMKKAEFDEAFGEAAKELLA